jgi:hypothetical protein
MDPRRKVVLWSLAVGVLLAGLAAGPAFEEYASRAGTLDSKPATVEKIVLTNGESLEGRWYDQELRLRFDDGSLRTKPAGGGYVHGVEEGDRVTVGLSHGTVVTVNGAYVRPHPYVLNFLTPFVAAAFVLAAVAGRGRYTSGYVGLAAVVCGVVGLAAVSRPWWPAAATVVGVAVPLLAFAVRSATSKVTPTAAP